MPLLVKRGSTAAHWNKPALELLHDTDTDGKPLLDGVGGTAWEPILICYNNFVGIIQWGLDWEKTRTNN